MVRLQPGNVVVESRSVKSADEGLSLQRREARLGARGRILVNQLLGRCLIERFHNKAELLVSGFLSWLFCEECPELLHSSSQSTALMAVTFAPNK